MCTSPVFSGAVSLYRKGIIFSHVFLDFFCGSKIRDLCLSYVKTNEQKKKTSTIFNDDMLLQWFQEYALKC